jgi:RNA-directed DNA polymerase
VKKPHDSIRGWRSYFGFSETPVVPAAYLTRWVRLRLRVALWRQWKTYRRRRAALIALGVRPRLARNTAASGRGPWYLVRGQSSLCGAVECLPKVARTSVLGRGLLA